MDISFVEIIGQQAIEIYAMRAQLQEKQNMLDSLTAQNPAEVSGLSVVENEEDE